MCKGQAPVWRFSNSGFRRINPFRRLLFPEFYCNLTVGMPSGVHSELKRRGSKSSP
jgi:hypothetical protein